MTQPSVPLVIVTATTDPFKTATFWRSWRANVGSRRIPIVMVVNGVKSKFNAHEAGWVDTLVNNTAFGATGDLLILEDEYMGVVPAFAVGVEAALRSMSATYIACFHDDLEILEDNWDLSVLYHFGTHPKCGLVGFGGAMGVGIDGMYDEGVQYRPQMLGRRDFGSNMVRYADHGALWREARQVAVLDGFSMIFRADWLDFSWRGLLPPNRGANNDPGTILIQTPDGKIMDMPRESNLFTLLAKKGVIHHAYDVAISRLIQHTGAGKADSTREVWYLPIYCNHAGGQTGVGDAGYQEWAKSVVPGGDQTFWARSHEIVYEVLRGALPYSVPDPVAKPNVKQIEIRDEGEAP